MCKKWPFWRGSHNLALVFSIFFGPIGTTDVFEKAKIEGSGHFQQDNTYRTRRTKKK